MKVLFVHDIPDGESLGVSDLIGSLKASGHGGDIVIAGMEGDFLAAIRRHNPDMIAISLMIGVHQNLLLLGRWIKRRYPTIPIIVGGPYMVVGPDIIDQPWVDFAGLGEADRLLPALCDAIEGRGAMESIGGLLFKRNGRVCRNPPDRLIDPLEELPLPDRSPYYRYEAFRRLSTKRFLTGRGCPHTCTFCYNMSMRRLVHGLGRYTRKKSPGRVCKEIHEVERVAPFKLVQFSDDIFFIDRQWLEEFLAVYAREIRKPFVCNITGNAIDPGIASRLAAAGCIGVGIGLETGNESLRTGVLGKHITNDQYRSTVTALHDVGIRVYTDNMLGLPGETLDQVVETLMFNRELGADYVQMLICIPFKGVPLTDWGIAHGYLEGAVDLDAFVAQTIPSMERSFFKCEEPEAMVNFQNLFTLLHHLSVPPSWALLLARQRAGGTYRLLAKVLSLGQLKSYYRVSLSSGLYMLLNLMVAKQRYARLMERVRRELAAQAA